MIRIKNIHFCPLYIKVFVDGWRNLQKNTEVRHRCRAIKSGLHLASHSSQRYWIGLMSEKNNFGLFMHGSNCRVWRRTYISHIVSQSVQSTPTFSYITLVDKLLLQGLHWVKLSCETILIIIWNFSLILYQKLMWWKATSATHRQIMFYFQHLLKEQKNIVCVFYPTSDMTSLFTHCLNMNNENAQYEMLVL